MKFIEVIRKKNKLKVYFCGIKIFSRTKRIVDHEFEKKYAKRFDPDISIEDKKYILTKQFELSAGYTPSFDAPKTFNEKLQYIKLYYDNPLMSVCGDKYKVKDYIKNIIGEEYIVPTLAVWDKPDEIDFDKLPNEFVLKVNWGSGQNIIVRDKSKMDIDKIKEKLSKWLKPESNHYFFSFESGYKNIEPKIICEKYVGELAENLTCYKIFNFSSKPYLIQAVFDDKTKEETINYYDLDWNKLDLKQNFPNNDKNVSKPKNLAKMLELAEKLAAPFKYFVRVDFFEVGDKVIFSEFTFFSDNGMAAFTPDSWDNKLGDLIHLDITADKNI
ncbi:ATP-grasp fold amidoligase family protein [Desulfovibrio litoralis]|uniref:TupA-like ATPgrasp n=1 Tax=Desulfovibrio litoralis DSM 11393 TaxID=1121455 RepID=A0A1M7T7C6_9BACT|nr:ATP-grasp fold amidoligase family protein [Desulfovibrio litoralis]SHN66630.1 TupA-like ATPgrasp [Desulfovibrio litoralis DSM 11393]